MVEPESVVIGELPGDSDRGMLESRTVDDAPLTEPDGVGSEFW